VQALEAEKSEIRARLESLKAGKATRVTKEQREEVEREWKRCGAVARRREKVARGMWIYIEDAVEKEQRGEVREMLGLDD
jgi:26S proteasome regulatory subunit (ATPase 3-interacting protein)